MNNLSSRDSIQTEVIELIDTAKCPECDMATSLTGVTVLGRQLCCENCGAALEIVALSPVLVDYAFIAPLNHHQPLISE
jgi:lysine biosynthesis protein LysW